MCFKRSFEGSQCGKITDGSRYIVGQVSSGHAEDGRSCAERCHEA